MAYRVAHFVDKMFYGGGQRHVQVLARNIARVGFESIVVSSNHHAFTDELVGEGVPCFTVDYRSPRSIGKLLRSQRVDLSHAHGARFAVALRLLQPFSKIPLIYTVHGYHGRKHGLLGGTVRRVIASSRLVCERMLNRWVDLLICVSEEDKDLVLAGRLVPPEKCRVVYNGVEMERFVRPAEESQDSVRKLYGNGPLVTCVARFTFQKGHTYLIHAVPQVLKAAPDTTFLMIGDGELLDEVRRLAYAELKLPESRVHFLDRKSDVRPYLWATDIFVLPSLWEGMPIALIEALAAGVPQVATDVCGNREVVSNNETGVLVQPASSEALADGIVRLVNDSGLRKRYADASVERASQRFSVTRMVESTVRAYQEVLDRAGKPV